jgi:cyclopropane fatty-acyl-phospholipid synthase-like methyltransferase
MPEIAKLLNRPEFPRSSKYERDWMLQNQMGPNAVWLCEWLCEALPIGPGMRILDLGCGRAMTSVFLAQEFGAKVWAADLWMSPDHNWRRVVAAGVQDRVCPIRAEAHALPFAQGFFDAVISVDAYHYFGTDELYLSYLAGFVRPGGFIGVVVPGMVQEMGETIPEHLTAPQRNGKRFWEDECRAFKTAEWWSRLWGHSSKVAGVEADLLTDGWRHWRDFERAVELSGRGHFPSDAEAIEKDAGRWLGFVRVCARRTEVEGMNLYEPGLGAKVGVDG